MTKYLSDENGEVIGEFSDTSRIVVFNESNIMRKSIDNKMFYKLYKDSTLVFINNNLIKGVGKTFFSLIRLLEFNTNEFICFNGIPANQKQLYTHLNLKPKNLYNHLRKLSELEILKKVKRGRNAYVIINPYFISFGSNNTDESLRIFSNSIWARTSRYVKRKGRKNKCQEMKAVSWILWYVWII